MKLISRLRRDGLHLNEFKSGILTAEQLIKEETEIDQMFAEARAAVEDEITADAGYGFDVEWELDDAEEEQADEPDEEELHMAAVVRLYESLDEYETQSDKIEKFCLPLLRIAGSDIAVDRSVQNIINRPDLTKLYLSYLSKFTPTSGSLVRQLEGLLNSADIVSDYQRLYIIGALVNCKIRSAALLRPHYKFYRIEHSHKNYVQLLLYSQQNTEILSSKEQYALHMKKSLRCMLGLRYYTHRDTSYQQNTKLARKPGRSQYYSNPK